MLIGGALKIPGVIGIAPDTLQIATAQSQKHARQSAAEAFALNTVKNFRGCTEFRQNQVVRH
jgi:hypothetical protein